MYYRNRGSARIMLVGGGLLSLLIVVMIIAHLGGESAKTSVETKQRVEKTIKEKIQKPLDGRYSKMFEGSFDVILQNVGPHEEDVIKAVRSLKKVGLKEAEDLLESAPVTVLTGMAKAEAQNAKTQLELAGATVKIDKRRN